MSRALLLDLDGTLCDSLPGLRDAYAAFLSRRGRIGTDGEFEALNGATLAGIVARLRVSHRLGDRESSAALEARYAEQIARARAGAGVMDGALELLAAARRCGWRTAVVTSGAGVEAEAWLAHRGLEDLIDTVVGGDAVAAAKPAPDGYLLALRQLSCAAAGSIGVEDSSAGLRGLRAAGVEAFEFAPLAEVQAADEARTGRIAKLGELIPRLERVS